MYAFHAVYSIYALHIIPQIWVIPIFHTIHGVHGIYSYHEIHEIVKIDDPTIEGLYLFLFLIFANPKAKSKPGLVGIIIALNKIKMKITAVFVRFEFYRKGSS